ncbi:hypothetical protein [Streptomyces sp. CC228A]|uniref:hypothetical protein n=1 Tax=Streptomyces sp. CC228A TaxID=2898186 RepID=UPI001F27FB96|nr:hypothetical protein [Streptomyces sp. CC228A]
MTPASAPEPGAGADETDEAARRLRTAFTEAARGVTPGPLPLAAVRREGRARRRRRATALATGAALVATALPLLAVRVLTDPTSAPVATPPRPSSPPASREPSPSARPAAPPTAVSPGERVDAGKGWTLWLTEDGKHTSGTDGEEDFRPIGTGNLDTSVPGVTHQSVTGTQGGFHSGLFYGTRNAARLELTDGRGTRIPGTLVELPGRPGWGGWYAHTPPAEDGGHPGYAVTLYDTQGNAVATLRAAP